MLKTHISADYSVFCIITTNYISSNSPVSESMMNPLTVMPLGTSGWVFIVFTVFLTDSGVSLNPSSHWFRSVLLSISLSQL